MRSFKTFVFLFAVLSFASCKGKNKATKTSDKTTGDLHFVTPPVSDEGEQVPTDVSYVRLQVSFYSIGAGIDYVNQEKYAAWLQNHSPKIKYDATHWGREGEINYCIGLSELNKKEQEKFVADTKEMLVKSILVHINENVPCEHKK